MPSSRIMWMRRALAAVLLLLVGCAKDIQNKEAVREGVVEYLRARKNLDLDMSAMQLDVSAVTFREKEAEATVTFVPKGGSASQGMTMKYQLERDGDKWKVKQKAEPAGAGHAVPPADMPPGHPPVGDGKK